MNISRKSRNLLICAYLGPLVFGLGGMVTRVDAQSVAALRQAATAQGADSKNDELRKRVVAALHTDPYFYDRHVTVSVENGVVVLRGFVFSDWDLRDALRLAKEAAGDSKVVDNLSIKEGGRR
jgi:osmotically-inducible protein OsmY